MVWPTATVGWAWVQPLQPGGLLMLSTNGGRTWRQWRTPTVE
ncbi:MAG: hypothetical protein OWU84_00640 [Firmicutes bacterium]|nr:hypothetical protein [Bacillota bacterium]